MLSSGTVRNNPSRWNRRPKPGVMTLGVILLLAGALAACGEDAAPGAQLVQGQFDPDATGSVDVGADTTAGPDVGLPDTASPDTVSPDTVSPDAEQPDVSDSVSPDVADAGPDTSGCTTDADCADEDPCTQGVCGADGTCSNTVVRGCCTLDAACDDNDPCTTDECADNACKNIPVPGLCCAEDAQCDDNNGCTADSCVAGACEHVAAPGCCNSDAECSDGDPCTADLCFGGTCVNSDPEKGCCQADEDCNDGNPCTVGSCVDGACTQVPTDDACCVVDDDCEDSNPCTIGQCSPNGECSFVALPGCCATDAECDDGDACTADLCFANQCLNSAADPSCCTTDAQCVDGNSCTVGSCEANACVFTKPDPSCCETTADCADDGDPCTIATCEQGTCGTTPKANCCTSDASCADVDGCTLDFCDSNGDCQNQPIAGCCNTASDCDDGQPCTADVCAGGTCESSPVEACCDPSEGDALAEFHFTPNVVDGVQFNPSSNATWRWRESTVEPYAGSATMYFGNSNSSGYCSGNSQPGSGTATLPVPSDPYPSGTLALPAGATVLVMFQARLDIRSSPDVDRLTLSVLHDGASTQVWSRDSVSVSDEWQSIMVDISEFAGEAVQLRFAFDVVNSGGGCQGAGPRIDEVRVVSSDCVEQQACLTNSDCVAAPNACYEPGGVCQEGVCVYQPSGDCCESDAACDDQNACTSDSCVLGACQNTPNPGCCSSDAECVSDNPCVIGACDGGSCTFTPTGDANCCASDADCGGDAGFCGAPTCEQGACVASGSTASQTLMNFVFSDQVDGWDTPSNSNYRWRETDEEFVSPGVSMYFGTNGGSQYCPPFNLINTGGVAYLPVGNNPIYPEGVIEFDASGKTTLRFSVLADVRTQDDVDQIVVRLESQQTGEQVVLWTKAALENNEFEEWKQFTIDLTPHAPFRGRLNVIFETVDAGAHGGCYDAGHGVYFDDIVIEQTCAP